MASSQSYPQAGPSSLPYHPSSPPYAGPDSSYQHLAPYPPNQHPQGNMSHHNHGPHRNNPLHQEFIPQPRNFRKGPRQRRFPQHAQQQPQMHYYQSQPMFPPHHAVMDPYHLPPEYYPPHDMWTPPFSPPPPPPHLAYAYQPPYPQSALPKQPQMPLYDRSPLPPTVQTPLTPVTSTSEPSLVHPEIDDDIPQNVTQDLNINDSDNFPDRQNIDKGIALQLERPGVQRALGVTISYTARPPASFVSSLDTTPSSPISAHIVFYTSTIDLVNSESANHKHESLLPEPSLTSIVTPETSTGAETPQLDSPRSSITSVSVIAKTISDRAEDQFQIQPESSLPPDATESKSEPEPEPTPEPKPEPEPEPEPVLEPASQPSPSISVTQPLPQPSQTVKKSWASLLRTQENDKMSTNGLPTSTIQGFSVPAIPPREPVPKPIRTPNILSHLTSSSVLSGRLPNLRARGLINLGNMCFANTVLQILMYCPPFYNLFTELEKYQNSKESVFTPLINATIELMQEFRPLESDKQEITDQETHRDEPFIPNVIYQALKEKKRFDSMRGGQQEDAEEFLGFYLDTLEDEFSSFLGNQTSKAAAADNSTMDSTANDTGDGWQEIGRKNKAVLTRTHKATDSPISRIFNGKFRTTLKVPGSRESAMIDPWSRLQLDIQPESVGTIEDALRYMTEQRTVQMSSATKGQVDANQQTLVEGLPPILILHLKRFLYDTAVNDVVKLSKKITFSPELVIPRDVLATSRRFQTHKYKLFGVLNHHGSSATGGHYTLDVLHPNPHGIGQEGWIRLDDDSVQDITVDDLLSKDFGDDKAAYLLFYIRHM